MSSKLVAYFSASGVTGEIAKTLAEAIGADIFEIKPKIPYTQADLDWMDKNARSTIEMNDPASRPEKAGAVRCTRMRNGALACCLPRCLRLLSAPAASRALIVPRG